jgi:hypothetical protein
MGALYLARTVKTAGTITLCVLGPLLLVLAFIMHKKFKKIKNEGSFVVERYQDDVSEENRLIEY